MNNKIIGNKFENNLSLILADLGYWVSMFTPKNYSNSQPADMIAVRDDVALLIDCLLYTSPSPRD